MTETLLPVRGIENLGPAGRRAVIDVSKSLGINPDWLVTVMSFESAGSFSPSKSNAAGSGAIGLIQFMPSTAASLGFTTAQLASMSQEEQIRRAVYAYFASAKGKMKTLEDVYLKVFYPKAMGQSDSWIVASQDGSTLDNRATTTEQEKGRARAIYNQNAGFDKSKAGVIRRGDIVSTIRAVYAGGGGKLRVGVPASELWRVGLYFAAFGVAAYGIYWWQMRPVTAKQRREGPLAVAFGV